MRFLMTVLSGAIIGAFGVYFTMDWQEEKLFFSVTSPAKFGDITYQNIALTNDGWNPAVNVKLYIKHPSIGRDNIQSSTAFKTLSDEPNGIATIDRVRRGESVIFSLAYNGQPIHGAEIKIVSDRSIANLREISADTELPLWASALLWIFGSIFALGFVSSITLPAYQNYLKRAKEGTTRDSP